jgi:hypothetical protein
LHLVSDGSVGGGFAEIVAATSIARPRADVAYCIHALARRLAKTRNWIVSTFALWLRLFDSFCVFDALVVALAADLLQMLY